MERSSSRTLRLSSSRSLRSGSRSLRSSLSRNSSSKGRDWAALAPELFALVLQRVQERGREEKGEGRRVVAVAGVCRYWRQLILQQACEISLSHAGLLQFPSALTQPGPRLQPLQCLLRQKGGVFTLFQNSPADDQGLEFLMAARCRWRLAGCIYDITANPKSFSKHAPGYMGRLKSNFWESDFTLFQCKQVNAPDRQKVVKMKSAVAVVRFSEHFIDRGIRQRRISCILPQPSAIATPYSNPFPASRQIAKRPLLPSIFRSCWLGWNCITLRHKQAIRRSNGRMMGDQRRNSTFSGIEGDDPGNRLVATDQATVDTPSLKLRSKIPAWDDEQHCWSLNFNGRATLSSMHNFQLINAESSSYQESSALDQIDQGAAAAESGKEYIVLQLGKIGKGLYTMDFCYPLSAFQALAVCLGSFATNVGLEA
ncbi:hypothetical protein O6H91_20G007000 [Diphasiastrum complanatum]|uniref:Uncharacterized protein n=1 Tax=Diphasiastrum complanatum TaxID=34168 RepID=A0ACC2AMH8_DIPCM|nr:hypothetical protein O6H91_20G007000 [Diphasiastrum complanatum]